MSTSCGKVLAKLPVAVDYWKLPKSHEKFKVKTADLN